jgi:hypothetical protein
MKEEKSSELTRGVIVFLVLALLTGVEYLLGTSQVLAVFLWIIAIAKAGLVLWFFMHVYRVTRSEGGH